MLFKILSVKFKALRTIVPFIGVTCCSVAMSR